MPRNRGGEDRERSDSRTGLPRRRPLAILVAVLVLMAAIGAGVAFGADPAVGDEATSVVEPTTGAAGPDAAVPTPQQIREAIESSEAEQAPETDAQVAEELPHRDLDGKEALELAEGVFGAELEGTAGIYDELEPDRFLSDYAAIVPASSLPEGAAGSGEGPAAEHPDMPVLLESSLPLRTGGGSGEGEVVDLELEHSEGELQPSNPLTEVGIPQELGEGITLPGPEVELTVAGAPPQLPPTDAEGQFAF